MPLPRRRNLSGMIRDTGLAVGASLFSSTSLWAQATSPAVAGTSHVEMMLKLLPQLGACGCLALLAWFQYQHALGMAGQVAAKNEEHGKAMADERQLRLDEAKEFAGRLEAVRQETAEERRRFVDAVMTPKPPRAKPATKKKARTK